MTAPKSRILVVEDEPSILSGLCDVLTYRGYRVDGVATGEGGLERGLDEAVDLVLLDIMLPGISGFEVCERLREERPDLPILMLTARGSEDDVLHGFRCGADRARTVHGCFMSDAYRPQATDFEQRKRIPRN